MSQFYHYSDGHFNNTSCWLGPPTTSSLYVCMYKCNRNTLCLGVTYKSSTSECQLLAVAPDASPYSAELTSDSQYKTFISYHTIT